MKLSTTLGLIITLVVRLAGSPSRCEEPKKLIKVRVADHASLVFVRIEPGEFLMGAPDDDSHAAADEKPRRRVRITHAFYLGAHEVTVGQFRTFVKDTQYKTNAEVKGSYRNWKNPSFPQTDDHPVVAVTWNDAKAFCAWLQKHPSMRAAGLTAARLPTEAEWEYACRAGTSSRYHSGSDGLSLRGFANVADLARQRDNRFVRNIAPWDDGYAFTAPVGSFKPNRLGLFDMHGNVFEWCEDYYGPYGDLPTTDPIRTKRLNEHELRVYRGGGWESNFGACSSTFRGRGSAAGDVLLDKTDLGLRVAARPE